MKIHSFNMIHDNDENKPVDKTEIYFANDL